MNDMEKEKVMHVLSVLLDELKQNLWHDSIASWNLAGDDGETLILVLYVYDGYNISLRRLTELVQLFEVKLYDISFRNNNGILEIQITLSND